MANCQFITFHGWAFDRRFWEPWHHHLSELGDFRAYDRGYFGNSQNIEEQTSADKIVLITHSFGLHLVEDWLFEQADLLVICGGFLYFHPYAAQYKRRSRLILQEMINNLEVKPKEVLRKFYQNCYAPQDAPEIAFEGLNQQLLLNDLRRLQNSDLDQQKLKKADKICILHGSDDHIVPNKKGRQIYTQLQRKGQYFEIKDAGHALPSTHHQQCLEFLRPEIIEMMQPKS
ncbi:MAG: alpha/beta hydrolase [Fodinibius sp.]|nr:alpha/beta hydrolase [Fodinibius sp.]